MDLKLNNEQLILKDTIRSLVSKEFREERVTELYRKKEYPVEFDKKIAELGLFGICFPQAHNGSELGAIETAIVIEELSRFSVDFGLSFGLNVLGGLVILNFGTESQRSGFLPRLVKGDVSFSVGYNEPFLFSPANKKRVNVSIGGSTIKGKINEIYSERRDVDKNFVLIPLYKGRKQALIVLPQKLMGDPVSVDTLGRNLLGLVRYNHTNISGLTDGFIIEHERLFQFITNWLKFINLMSCIGNMDNVINKTIQYSKEREQFGSPIGTFQSLQHLIVDAKTAVDASQLFGYWIAWLIDKYDFDLTKILKEVNMASTFVAQAFVRVVNTGMQVMGGYGYMVEGYMERYIRDARMAAYFPEEGFLQKISIAKEFGIIPQD